MHSVGDQYGARLNLGRIVPSAVAGQAITEARVPHCRGIPTVYSLPGGLVHRATLTPHQARDLESSFLSGSFEPGLKQVRTVANLAATLFATAQKPETKDCDPETVALFESVWLRYQVAREGLRAIQADLRDGLSAAEVFCAHAQKQDICFIHPEECEWYFDETDTRVQAIVVVSDEDFDLMTREPHGISMSGWKLNYAAGGVVSFYKKSDWKSLTEPQKMALLNHEYTHTINEILGLVDTQQYREFLTCGIRWFSDPAEQGIEPFLVAQLSAAVLTLQDEIIAVMAEYVIGYDHESLTAEIKSVIDEDYTKPILKEISALCRALAKTIFSEADQTLAEQSLDRFFQGFKIYVSSSIELAMRFVKDPVDLIALALVPITEWQNCFVVDVSDADAPVGPFVVFNLVEGADGSYGLDPNG